MDERFFKGSVFLIIFLLIFQSLQIRAVTHQFDEILVQIKVDEKIRMKIEEPLSIKLVNIDRNTDLPSIKFDDSGVHFQMLINILLRMRFNERDRNDLISLCKKEYKGNKNQLADIHEFQHTYSPNRALQWYIHKPFLQKILNKAFLMENVDIFYLFRSFIRDICHQLRRNQCQSSVRAYKGHLMSTNELNSLKKSIGKLTSVNSVLLASIDRESVLDDLEETTSSKNMKQVLFEIDADPQVDVSIPFAKININGGQNDENDIIFMAGSIFRLVSIQYDKNKTCIIRMTLCGNKEPDLKKFFEHVKNEYGYGETNLLSLGIVLRDIGKLDLAEKYLSRMLNELTPDDRLLDALYPSLGLVAKDKGDYDKCLYWYQKSLKNYMITRPYDYITIGDTYNTIGMIYHGNKSNYEKALDYYHKAILIFKQFDAEKDPMMAIFYDNIGAVHEEQRNYSEALVFYQKALNNKKKHVSTNNLQLSKSYKNIAAAHGYLGSYDTALEYYQKILKIQMKLFPLQHPDIALTYANMAAVYAAKNRSQQALTYWHKASAIFRSTLLPQHPLVIKIEEEIKRVSSKIAYYSPVKKTERKRITPT
jgi:tetratricopeptide (TPR) repeat protein